MLNFSKEFVMLSLSKHLSAFGNTFSSGCQALYLLDSVRQQRQHAAA
jgi:hypothetical protein